MFCTQCGNANVTTKFCPKCGHKIARSQAAPRTRTAQAPQRPAQPRATGNPVPPAPPLPGPNPAFTPPEPEPGYYGEPGQPPPAQDKKAPETARIFAKYEPGETGFFRSFYHFFFDTDSFFARADFDQEILRCFGVVIFVNLFTGISAAVLISTNTSNMVSGMDKAVMGALMSAASPFVLSLFGMVLMSLVYRQHASWKRIFGIYAYSTLAYLPCLLPFCLMKIGCTILFIHYVHKGFENVFGLDSFSAWLFALGIPALFWTIVILGLGWGFASTMT